MYEAAGKAAMRFALAYLRRRYARPLRLALGLVLAAIAAIVYWLVRRAPEG